MPANDYFKVAAANIRRAVDYKRKEISDLRAQMEIKKSEIHKEVNKTLVIKKGLEVNISKAQTGDEIIDRPTKVKQVGEMQSKILDMQHGLNQTHEQLASQIKGIERDLVGLEQLASSLETRN